MKLKVILPIDFTYEVEADGTEEATGEAIKQARQEFDNISISQSIQVEPVDDEQTVKPVSMQDRYWYITDTGRIKSKMEMNEGIDIFRRSFGNYFYSRDAAKAKRKSYKAILNSDDARR